MANNELTVKEKGIASYLATPEVRENIVSVLGKEHADAFVSDLVACVQNNTELAKCTNKSIFSAALLSKSINLPLTPQLGYAYLVPFNSKKNENGKTVYLKEAVFQMGWKGYVQLALRSNNFRKIITTDVRKGEINGYNPFDDKYEITPIDFEKRNAKDDKGNYIVPIIGYYAKLEMTSGFIKEMYMSQEDMLNYAITYSKAFRSDRDKHTSYSFWTTKFEDMAKKTMLRQLLSHWGVLSTELQEVIIRDEKMTQLVNNEIVTTDVGALPEPVGGISVDDMKPEFTEVVENVNLEDL